MSHVVISEGTVIDDDVWCDHHTYIGCDTRIAQGAQILYGAKVYHRVSIGRGAWIGGFTCNDAIIEDATVVLGQLVHKFRDATVGVPEKSPIIRKSAFVGMNAFIIGGIEVGCGAYIAGGAVLTRSAKPGRLYTGAPAKEVGRAPSGFSFPKNNIP
jgi:acetyltransferase-like isoleucine patch superfamily enzyme